MGTVECQGTMICDEKVEKIVGKDVSSDLMWVTRLDDNIYIRLTKGKTDETIPTGFLAVFPSQSTRKGSLTLSKNVDAKGDLFHNENNGET